MRRGKITYNYCKTHPRHKQRQGLATLAGAGGDGGGAAAAGGGGGAWGGAGAGAGVLPAAPNSATGGGWSPFAGSASAGLRAHLEHVWSRHHQQESATGVTCSCSSNRCGCR